jgi:hypothetical protein
VEGSPAAAAAGGGEPAGKFFAALDGDWQLTAAQRARLAPAVTAALNAGWTPPALTGFTAANTGGVRNPYAVLAARLSHAELSPPYAPPGCSASTATRHDRARAASHQRRPAARRIVKTGIFDDASPELSNPVPSPSGGAAGNSPTEGRVTQGEDVGVVRGDDLPVRAAPPMPAL